MYRLIFMYFYFSPFSYTSSGHPEHLTNDKDSKSRGTFSSSHESDVFFFSKADSLADVGDGVVLTYPEVPGGLCCGVFRGHNTCTSITP